MHHRQCSTCCAQGCELLGDDLTRLSDMHHRQCSTCCAQVCELLGDDLTRLSDTKDVFKCLVEVMLLHHHQRKPRKKPSQLLILTARAWFLSSNSNEYAIWIKLVPVGAQIKTPTKKSIIHSLHFYFKCDTSNTSLFS